MKKKLIGRLIASVALALSAIGANSSPPDDGVIKSRLGSLRRDDLVVVDVKESVNTNAVRDLMEEYDRAVIRPREDGISADLSRYPVVSVNGKTGSVSLAVADIPGAASTDDVVRAISGIDMGGYLKTSDVPDWAKQPTPPAITEADPTVPEWAKQPEKPAETDPTVPEWAKQPNPPTFTEADPAFSAWLSGFDWGRFITAETDPTVPEWAKQPEKPAETDPTVPEWAKQPNPPTLTEADPTVPEWAKQPEKPVETDPTFSLWLSGFDWGRFITVESDPTVPEWAKQPEKPAETDPTVPEWAKQPNPPTITETDPTVPEWAKQPTPPTPTETDPTVPEWAKQPTPPTPTETDPTFSLWLSGFDWGRFITAETDPTVPEWAKQPEKPAETDPTVPEWAKQSNPPLEQDPVFSIWLSRCDFSKFITVESDPTVPEWAKQPEKPAETDPTVPEWAKQQNPPVEHDPLFSAWFSEFGSTVAQRLDSAERVQDALLTRTDNIYDTVESERAHVRTNLSTLVLYATNNYWAASNANARAYALEKWKADTVTPKLESLSGVQDALVTKTDNIYSSVEIGKEHVRTNLSLLALYATNNYWAASNANARAYALEKWKAETVTPKLESLSGVQDALITKTDNIYSSMEIGKEHVRTNLSLLALYATNNYWAASNANARAYALEKWKAETVTPELSSLKGVQDALITKTENIYSSMEIGKENVRTNLSLLALYATNNYWAASNANARAYALEKWKAETVDPKLESLEGVQDALITKTENIYSSVEIGKENVRTNLSLLALYATNNYWAASNANARAYALEKWKAELIPGLVATGVVSRASSYGTQTRWTDSTGCVWEVEFDGGKWVAHDVGLPGGVDTDWYGPYWSDDIDEYHQAVGWFVSSSNFTPEFLSDDRHATSLSFSWTYYDPEGEGTDVQTTFTRTMTPRTNLVGRTALVDSTGNPLFAVRSITDGTNTIDASGNVYAAQGEWIYTVRGVDYRGDELVALFGGSGDLYWTDDSNWESNGVWVVGSGWFVNDLSGSCPIWWWTGGAVTQEASSDRNLVSVSYSYMSEEVTARRAVVLLGRLAREDIVDRKIASIEGVQDALITKTENIYSSMEIGKENVRTNLSLLALYATNNYWAASNANARAYALEKWKAETVDPKLSRLSFEACQTVVVYSDGTTNRLDVVGVLSSNSVPDKATAVSVRIGTSVTDIGNNAFRGCSLLNSVLIPDTVSVIGADAFRECAALLYVKLPDSITELNTRAFFGCTAMTRAVIPRSVTRVLGGTFQACSQLRSVEIPASVNLIAGNAFYGCAKLVSLDIPASVLTLQAGCFNNCPNLSRVTFHGRALDEVTAMPNYGSWGIDARVIRTDMPLSGKTYDFSTDAGRYMAVRDIVEALGGKVINFPEIGQ